MDIIYEIRRRHTSGGNLFDLFMALFSQELEHPQNPGRFSVLLTTWRFSCKAAKPWFQVGDVEGA